MIDFDKRYCHNCGNGHIELNHYWCEIDKKKHNALETCGYWCYQSSLNISRIDKENNEKIDKEWSGL